MTAVAFALLVVLVAGGAPARAQTSDRLANDIAREIMSPYCPGVTLHDCPSEAAVALRARIATWAEQGLSRAQILERLEDELGPGIRAAPPRRGIGLWAWVLPPAAVAGGGLIAVALLRRRRAVATPPPPSPEERARVEAELAAFRGSG